MSRGHHLALVALLLLPGCRTRLLDPADGDELAATDAAVDHGLVDLLLAGDLTRPAACASIYTIDGSNSMLAAFDPPTGTFRNLGRVRCPTTSAPDAMAINRLGTTVWVEFQDGSFFEVDLATLKCSPTAYREQLGLDGVVGMSFSSDTPGGAGETLFLGGGQNLVLARRDLGTFVDTQIGPLPAFLELSGTGAGELWGFFPVGASTDEAFIAPLDKTTAALGPRLRLPTLPPNQGNFTFAAWGGAFWVFQEEGGSTSVYRVDASSGAVKPVKTSTGRHVIGSGTSVCAPGG